MLMSMTERRITVDGREMRVGTVQDAGRLCVTPRAPYGVSGDAYLFDLEPLGAPGPILVADPWPEIGAEAAAVKLRDGTGAELRDLDAVERWNALRPGSGNRGPASIATMRMTRLRWQVLTDAQAGRLAMDVESGRLVSERLVAAPHDPPRVVRAVRELTRIGALLEPDAAGVVGLSGDGATLLARHPHEPTV